MKPLRKGARFALSVAWGATAAAALYAALRVVQASTGAPVDPALVSFHAHSGFFWRAWTAGYAGGMIALAAWILAGRDPERVARALAKAIPIVAALAIAQALLVP